MVLPKLQYCRVTSKLCDGGVICGRVSELSSPYEAVDRHFCNFFPPCDRDLRSIESPAPPQLPIMDAGSPVGQPRPRIGLPMPGTVPPTVPVMELLLAPTPPPLLDATELAEVSTAPVELLEHPPTPLMRSCKEAFRSDGAPQLPCTEVVMLLMLLLPAVLVFVVGPPLPTPTPTAAPELDASPFICSVCSSVWRERHTGRQFVREVKVQRFKFEYQS